MTDKTFAETQLPKVKEAIKTTGGRYYQPTYAYKGKSRTITFAHAAQYEDRVIRFSPIYNDPYRIQFYEEGKPRRFKVSIKSPVNILVRQIKLYLKSA